jgi:hypothetical protein
MTDKSISKELHEEFQSALEELEILTRANLKTPLGPFTTQEELAAFEDLGAALDKAEANCSRIAREIAAL